MIVRTVVLIAVWVSLQGELTFGNVGAGLVVVLAVAVLFPVEADPAGRHRLHPVALVSFVVALAVDLVRSTWTVLVAVVAPTPERTAAQVIDVAITSRSTLVTSIVANSITLTPGTLTVDVRPTADGHVLAVHVLGQVDPDEFVGSVQRLEARVAAAITPSEPR